MRRSDTDKTDDTPKEITQQYCGGDGGSADPRQCIHSYLAHGPLRWHDCLVSTGIASCVLELSRQRES